MGQHIRKGDTVIVIAGKDKGKTGSVLRVLGAQNRVLVEGINIIKKHMRPGVGGNRQGGIIEKEAPIHLSNVMPVDPKTGDATRVRIKQDAQGKRVRVSVKSGSEF